MAELQCDREHHETSRQTYRIKRTKRREVNGKVQVQCVLKEVEIITNIKVLTMSEREKTDPLKPFRNERRQVSERACNDTNSVSTYLIGSDQENECPHYDSDGRDDLLNVIDLSGGSRRNMSKKKPGQGSRQGPSLARSRDRLSKVILLSDGDEPEVNRASTDCVDITLSSGEEEEVEEVLGRSTPNVSPVPTFLSSSHSAPHSTPVGARSAVKTNVIRANETFNVESLGGTSTPLDSTAQGSGVISDEEDWHEDPDELNDSQLSSASGPREPGSQKQQAGESSSSGDLCLGCQRLYVRMRLTQRTRKKVKDPLCLYYDQWMLQKPWRPRGVGGYSRKRGKLFKYLPLLWRWARSPEKESEMETCVRPHIFLQRNLELCQKSWPKPSDKRRRWRRGHRPSSDSRSLIGSKRSAKAGEPGEKEHRGAQSKGEATKTPEEQQEEEVERLPKEKPQEEEVERLPKEKPRKRGRPRKTRTVVGENQDGTLLLTDEDQGMRPHRLEVLPTQSSYEGNLTAQSRQSRQQAVDFSKDTTRGTLPKRDSGKKQKGFGESRDPRTSHRTDKPASGIQKSTGSKQASSEKVDNLCELERNRRLVVRLVRCDRINTDLVTLVRTPASQPTLAPAPSREPTEALCPNASAFTGGRVPNPFSWRADNGGRRLTDDQVSCEDFLIRRVDPKRQKDLNIPSGGRTEMDSDLAGAGYLSQLHASDRHTGGTHGCLSGKDGREDNLTLGDFLKRCPPVDTPTTATASIGPVGAGMGAVDWPGSRASSEEPAPKPSERCAPTPASWSPTSMISRKLRPFCRTYGRTEDPSPCLKSMLNLWDRSRSQIIKETEP